MRCEYMIDIAPFGALCEHPCKLIGGAPVETHCAGHCELMMCELETENARLRELCADMWRFTGTACRKYPRLFDPAAQGGQMVQPNMIDTFEQRMQELGIEVDGWATQRRRC